MYNYPLTSTQIQHLFDPRKHLQIRFSFDTWTSSSGNIIENNGLLGPWSEYHGYITNCTVISSDYAVGSKCLMVGNVDSTSTIANLTVPGVINLADKCTSVCFWLKSPTGSWCSTFPLFSYTDGFYECIVHGWGNQLTLCKQDPLGTAFVENINITCDKDWHHYAFVNDTNCGSSFYVDGALFCQFESYFINFQGI